MSSLVHSSKSKHEKKNRVIFENVKCTISDKNHRNKVITVVPMTKNRMFPLKFCDNENQLVNMAYEDKSWLWHLRYGHLNFSSLKSLTSNALVLRIPKVENHKQICEECTKGKHARKYMESATTSSYYSFRFLWSYPNTKLG